MKSKKVNLDWKVSGSKIVFHEAPDGPELFEMDGERFGLLTNGEHVRGILAEVAQEQLFPAAWGLREYVEIGRLLQKCLNQAQVAGLWGVPEPMVRAFYGQALQKFQHAPEQVRQERERQGSSETEKDYCLSLRAADVRMSEDPRAGQDFLEIPKMATILKEFGPGGTAEKMKMDFADLQIWIEKNGRYLALFGYKDNLF